MEIEIRQATVADRVAIQRFIKKAYGPLARFKGPARWNWQFVDNPFRPDESKFASVWIAWDGSEVVGQTAVQHGRCWIGGEPHDFGWIVDVMVLAQYRGQGLGHRIYNAIAASVPTTLTMTMAPATRRIAERQGALTLPPVRCMFRPLRCNADLVRRFVSARAIDSPRWHRPHQLLTHAAWACRSVALSMNAAASVATLRGAFHQTSTNSCIDEVSQFDESVNRLAHRVRSAYDLVCIRNGEYLNWRYVDVPDLCYRRFLMRDGDELVGLLVTREPRAEELPIGILCELLVAPGCEAQAGALLDHAMSVSSISMKGIVAGASAPWLVRTLVGRGFLTVKKHHPTIVTSNADIRAACSRQPFRTFFTKGDHDWDQVHVA